LRWNTRFDKLPAARPRIAPNTLVVATRIILGTAGRIRISWPL
jgi:hypothetical protein